VDAGPGADRDRPAACGLAPAAHPCPLYRRSFGQPPVVDVHLFQPVRPTAGQYLGLDQGGSPRYDPVPTAAWHPGDHGADRAAHRRGSLPAQSLHAAIWQYHTACRAQRRTAGLARAAFRPDPDRDRWWAAGRPCDGVVAAWARSGGCASVRLIHRSRRRFLPLPWFPSGHAWDWLADHALAWFD